MQRSSPAIPFRETNMREHDQTSMGGERETFLTTHWSLIEDV